REFDAVGDDKCRRANDAGEHRALGVNGVSPRQSKPAAHPGSTAGYTRNLYCPGASSRGPILRPFPRRPSAMRRVLALLPAVGCLTAAAVVATAQRDTPSETASVSKFAVTSEAKNPWTSLAPNVAPDQFQFAIVSDRTGGHRRGVFSKAVQQVNLLQPEF